jgi:hypothetical protein
MEKQSQNSQRKAKRLTKVVNDQRDQLRYVELIEARLENMSHDMLRMYVSDMLLHCLI